MINFSAASPTVIEVGPRDGLQNEKVPVTIDDKADFILRLIGAGAKRIEAGSFVNPKAVPQMADSPAVIAQVRGARDLKAAGVSLIGLALNRRGFDRALEAGVDEVNFVVVASESFNRRNQGVAIAQTLADIAAVVPDAASAGVRFGVTIGAAFGCPFEGEVSEDQLSEVIRALAGSGVSEIALADTIGVGDPVAVGRRITLLKAIAPKALVRCHFHNTRNTGLANAYAAILAGVDALDASTGGIGGCPFAPAATGNIPTEDLVYMMHRMGLQTSYDLDALTHTVAWLAQVLGGAPLPGMLARAGNFPPAAA
jgi:isopropylmalate/homocitrate/citramalate synthase